MPVVGTAIGQIMRSIADRGLGFTASGNDVVIHPGSGSEKKNWPREKFVELAQRLGEKGIRVRVLAGEVEREKWTDAEIAQFANVVAPADYVGLFNELKSARVVVANDSGPGHLAGIMGLPT